MGVVAGHNGVKSAVAGKAGAGSVLSQQVLRTDASGMPLEWIDYKEAVRLHCLGQVAYAFGSRLYALHGGINARSGIQTVIEVNSMMATQGSSGNPGSLRGDYVPPLNNETLFRRDANLCMYCNVVAACRRCNNQKASRTPEQAGMQLLAVPFTPTYAEYIYLKGRRVLADQMEYLLAHFPRSSPLHARIQRFRQ
jgi:hypothetical protein